MEERVTIWRNGKPIECVDITHDTTPKRQPEELFIGCPLKWFNRVYPIVQGKEQLAVALWLYRRHSVCKTEWFKVSNEKLREEIPTINRYAKYRAFQNLEKAKIITTKREGKHAIQVKLLRSKAR
jgi:hypothetical protein